MPCHVGSSKVWPQGSKLQLGVKISKIRFEKEINTPESSDVTFNINIYYELVLHGTAQPSPVTTSCLRSAMWLITITCKQTTKGSHVPLAPQFRRPSRISLMMAIFLR